jgi:NPCBM/NEW2 domain
MTHWLRVITVKLKIKNVCRWLLTGPVMILLATSFATADGIPAKVELIDGSSLDIQLLGIDSSGNLLVQDSDRKLTLADLVSIETATPETSFDKNQSRLIFVDGGEVRAKDFVLDGDAVAFADSVIQSPVSMELVRAIILKNDTAVDQAMVKDLSDKDQVVVVNEGQAVTLEGVLEGISAEKVLLKFEGKSRSINRDKVLAVVFANLSGAKSSETGLSAIFADGSRLNGNLQDWQNGNLTLKLREKTVIVPAQHLSRLEIRSDRLRFVSDIESLVVESKPIFSPTRPWQRNLSVEGNPLMLQMEGGKRQTFRRGVGVSAYSKLVVPNPGKFEKLLGWVGIDAETEGRGNCRVLVRGDGITLFDRQILGNAPALPLDLDVSGVEQIELIVEPGEQFDLSDHVDFANLRMTK